MRQVLLVLASIFLSYSSSADSQESPRRSVAAGGAAVIQEINRARQSPAIYADYLVELRAHLHGDILRLPGRTIIRTREGARAIDEAIQYLRHSAPLAPLVISRGISAAAAEHVADQANGSFGHDGLDHSNPGERMNRDGTWSTLWGENISYGKANARDIVMTLIVDDGVRGRKHRKNIFNPTFNYAGAAIGPHARYGTVCSIDFAGGYTERGRIVDLLFARN